MNPNATFRGASRDYAVDLVRTICALAGSLSILDEARAELRDNGVLAAVTRHESSVLFDWLITMLSFQGIADAVAQQYIDNHGQATWAAITRDLAARPACPKLRSYWQFYDCRYEKGSRTCAQADYLLTCPLPSHDLRNGRLNQTAFSLYLFIRDVASGDLVGWIDQQLAEADSNSGGLISWPDCETHCWSRCATSTAHPTRSGAWRCRRCCSVPVDSANNGSR
jgi:hypothetical protein